MVHRTHILMLIFLAVGPRLATAEGPSEAAEDFRFFETRIRPVLAQHCYKCHSAASGKLKGGLAVDSRASIRAGGESGPAVVPGKPEASLLLAAIAHSDPELTMPPQKERLPDSVVKDVETWIRMGAPDPRVSEPVSPVHSPLNLESARRFWSFQKPVPQQIPVPKNQSWTRRELDHFILARLETAGLTPQPDAEATILLRRLHFDLVGIPPEPDVVRRFLELLETAGIELALNSEVDRLLASPEFGERWGRHWLDVARFAESSGNEANMSFPYAWRYRDYVINALNADVPFDRFLMEQLAGDLLPFQNDAERARLLIATGFLAVGPKNLDEGNEKQFAADVIDEQIDAVSRSVIASSIACARCHDHKFDPYSMEDYYALAGIFASTKTYFGTYITPSNRVGGDPLVLPRGANLPIYHASIPAKQVDTLKAQLAALKKEQEDGTKAAFAAALKGQDTEKIFSLRDALRIFWQSGGIEGQLEKVDESGQALPLTMGVLDRAKIADSPLFERGEVNRPGQPIPRRFPAIIQVGNPDSIPGDQSGRLELARWLIHPDHPLTARVMCNRIWRHLFGAGLVRTVDNFGSSGEPPSHPELLDQLAVRFMANGWSVKAMVREIVLSRTYRQGSAYQADAFRMDPENRLLWRMPKRRLDAESIRDSMLAVSGELNRSRAEASLVGRVIGDRPIALIGLDAKLPRDLDGSVHRSVYLPVIRDRLPDVLDLFDFAEPSLVTGDRETTNVPVQALYLMNSTFVQKRAEGLAARLMNEADGNAKSDAARVRLAFHLCFNRGPNPKELSSSLAFLDPSLNLDEETEAVVYRKRLAAFCQALLSTAEFRNLD